MPDCKTARLILARSMTDRMRLMPVSHPVTWFQGMPGWRARFLPEQRHTRLDTAAWSDLLLSSASMWGIDVGKQHGKHGYYRNGRRPSLLQEPAPLEGVSTWHMS